MFEGTLERLVLYLLNFRTFSGLFTTSNQFRVRAWPSRPIYNYELYVFSKFHLTHEMCSMNFKKYAGLRLLSWDFLK